jgi:phosphoglycolate phosphatase
MIKMNPFIPHETKHLILSIGLPMMFSVSNGITISILFLCYPLMTLSFVSAESNPFRKYRGQSLYRNNKNDDNIAISRSVTDIMNEESMSETQKLLEYYRQVEKKSDMSHPHSPTIWTTRLEASKFVQDHVDAIMFDCDGVLYRGKDLSPDASNTLQKLLEDGKQCFFVTNNAAVNRQQLLQKISDLMNCTLLTLEQMVGSTYACTQYLKQNLPIGSRVHVIGSEGLCSEILDAGYHVSNGEESTVKQGMHVKHSMSREELADYEFPEHPVDAVCVGLDTAFSYRKLAIANVLLQRNPNALFLSTNQDAFDLVGGDGRHLPGNGCIVKALEHGSQRRAINVGKPSTILAQMILQEHNLDPTRTMFVGDRLDTDIQFANDSGMISVLVLTGVTTADTILSQIDDPSRGDTETPNESSIIMPDIILPYMGLLA